MRRRGAGAAQPGLFMGPLSYHVVHALPELFPNNSVTAFDLSLAEILELELREYGASESYRLMPEHLHSDLETLLMLAARTDAVLDAIECDRVRAIESRTAAWMPDSAQNARLMALYQLRDAARRLILAMLALARGTL
jgi:hypothetical protein